MRVTKLETFVVDNAPPYWGMRYWLIIKLHTDEGIVGLGERPTGWSSDLRPQVALMHELCDAFVIGQNPFDIEDLWHRMYAGIHDSRHPDMTRVPTISAIEMALWDIVGKAVGQPVFNLLGGRTRERLRSYAYLPVEDVLDQPEVAAERALQLVEDGWTACKIEPFVPFARTPRPFTLAEITRAARIFEHIRNAVGDRLEVGLGTHGQFSPSEAVRIAHHLEEFSPMWFEEPVPPEGLDEMAWVAAHTSIPIAAGERLSTKFEFSAALEKKAMGIVQLDVGQCGGILESKKIAAIAEAHHAYIAPHMFVGPVATAAAIQLDVCTINFLIQEFNTGPRHAELLREPILVERGEIIPPTGPGLGVELDEDVLKRHLVE